VVTWWPSVVAGRPGPPAAAPATKGRAAKRSREVESLAVGPDESGKPKRDRKQTQLFDPVLEAASSTPAARLSPVDRPQKLPVPQANAGQEGSKRRRTVPQRLSPDLAAPASASAPAAPATPSAATAAKLKKGESTWPAAWKKLLDRVVPVPRDSLPEGASQGLHECSYVQQMRGTRTRWYIGRPVRVLAHGNWQGGVASSLEEVNGKRRVMLSSGDEEDFETTDKAGRLRYDDRACGDFSVGRHAQVT